MIQPQVAKIRLNWSSNSLESVNKVQKTVLIESFFISFQFKFSGNPLKAESYLFLSQGTLKYIKLLLREEEKLDYLQNHNLVHVSDLQLTALFLSLSSK